MKKSQLNRKIIPIARPLIGREEMDEVKKVMESGVLSIGPKIEEFEKLFAELIGCKYAVAVSSGTSALHLCVKSAGIKIGDEVVTSPFSFIASANCILYERGKPVFSDIDENTYNLDPNKIKKAITHRTKALLPVHIFGHPCDMDPITEIAEKYDLDIIEDACESIYSEYKGKKAGTFGLASAFAFYPNKQIVTGEGGMITTDNEEVAELCRKLRNHGRNENDKFMEHNMIGYNYRLNEISCAMGIVQLKKIKYIIERREQIAQKYNKELEGRDYIIKPYVSPDVRHSWFVYVVKLKDGIDRDKVIQIMDQRGIITRPYLPSIHLQPIYRKLFKYEGGTFPAAEKASKSTLAIPFYIGISDEDIRLVCEELQKAAKKSKTKGR